MVVMGYVLMHVWTSSPRALCCVVLRSFRHGRPWKCTAVAQHTVTRMSLASRAEVAILVQVSYLPYACQLKSKCKVQVACAHHPHVLAASSFSTKPSEIK